MVFEALIALGALISGIVLLTLSSEKAIEHLIKIASEWRVSPLMVGLVLASIGTGLPEIINSFESSFLGYGDINMGDSLGSALTQMSLMLGLLPFLGKAFRVKKKMVVVIGACEVLALILAVSVAEDGYVSRVNALLLVAGWMIFMLLIRNLTEGKIEEKAKAAASSDERHLRHFMVAILGFIGVSVGAFIVIESVITLSTIFNVSEYLISFFGIAVGTSLPELVVGLAAVRRKQYDLAIGDIVGSSIIDAGFSIGIGPLFFPITVDGKLILITGLYGVFVSIVIVSLLALRGKVDRKFGGLCILLYLLSYVTLSAI